MTAESDFRTTEGKRMKTPIEVGRYRLRNGRTAKVVEITTMKYVRTAAGFVEAAQGDADEAMEWTRQDGMFGNDPGPWDLVERIDTDLPTTLNSAVKAAEIHHKELRAHAKTLQALADDATRLADEALVQLERLEKECEVGSHDHPVVQASPARGNARHGRHQ